MKPQGGKLGVTLGLVIGLAAAWTSQAQSIQPITGLGGSGVNVRALNQAGQVCGGSRLANDPAQHGFLFDQGISTDLGTLGGMNSFATALNNLGEVVGNSDTANGELHAFFWANGSMSDLGTLGGTFSMATAVNDAGDVVGESQVPGGPFSHAFLYRGGTLTDLGTLGGQASSAVDVNNAGQVLGQSETAMGELHPFLYENGSMTDLGTLGGFLAMAFDLNESGDAVGESFTAQFDTHAFLFSNGAMTDLGTLGGFMSTARRVNDAGMVAGHSLTAGNMAQHAFLYDDGLLLDLGTLGGAQSFVNDMNNHGDIVGDSMNAAGAMRAAIWRNRAIEDLNDVLPAGSGWVLMSAQKINDARQVIGFGTFNGQVTRYLLTLPGNNRPPVADAGPDQVLDCPSPVQLSGAQSFDPDGDALDFVWTWNGQVVGQTADLTLSLPQGVHTFDLSVTDPSGAASSDSVVVTIEDLEAPTVVCLVEVVRVADLNCLATVPDLTGQTVATDNCDHPTALVLSQTPAPGTSVGVGVYDVVVTARDSSGLESSCTTRLRVNDVTPPVIAECPGEVTLIAGEGGVVALPDLAGALDVSDTCTAAEDLVRIQVPEPGTLVNVGTHTVTVAVLDLDGNAAECVVTVLVREPCALVVASLTATPEALRPPNREMIEVTVSVEATSSCGGEVRSEIVSVESSDPVTGQSDSTFPDVEITGPLTVRLRAETVPQRADRVYTIRVRTTDDFGNSTTGTLTVAVEKSNNSKDKETTGVARTGRARR